MQSKLETKADRKVANLANCAIGYLILMLLVLPSIHSYSLDSKLLHYTIAFGLLGCFTDRKAVKLTIGIITLLALTVLAFKMDFDLF